MKTTTLISRFLLGIVFIFSGFVKGVDPLGTAYKIEDYLLAYQMDWALTLSLLFAFGLIAFEFSLGVMLIFNLLPKFTRWSMAILMLFFTVVTFYDALYNPVPDCGCFGDALILSNWQTFYKNIFLDFFVIGLFFYRQEKINLSKHLAWSLALFIGFLSFSYYNLQHLPLIDFRFWKIGSQVMETNKKPIELYLTYQNKNTGEKQEFLSPNFPYQDSVWLANWKYKSTREFNPNINSESIMFFDLEGNNATTEILGFSGKLLLFISHNLDAIDTEESEKINQVIQIADNEKIPVFLITASVGKKIDDFVEQNKIDIPVFLADDIDLKTIIRSNPGLILLENGKVINKWAVTDFPSDVNQIFE
jgi:uncharacterized membrane protein YphA (DoxX/SURF4 family)